MWPRGALILYTGLSTACPSPLVGLYENLGYTACFRSPGPARAKRGQLFSCSSALDGQLHSFQVQYCGIASVQCALISRTEGATAHDLLQLCSNGLGATKTPYDGQKRRPRAKTKPERVPRFFFACAIPTQTK